jgi:hypothetical protein
MNHNLPKDVLLYNIITSNSDIEEVVNLYKVNKDFRTMLDDPYTLRLLEKNWLHNRKINAEIYTFADFFDEYHRYYGTELCMTKYPKKECLNNVVKHGNLDDIKKYKNYLGEYFASTDVQDETQLQKLFQDSLENHNFEVAEYILRNKLKVSHEFDDLMKKIQTETLWVSYVADIASRTNDIEIIKWLDVPRSYVGTGRTEVSALLARPYISNYCFQWIVDYMGHKDKNWIDNYIQKSRPNVGGIFDFWWNPNIIPYLVAYFLLLDDKRKAEILIDKYEDNLGYIFFTVATISDKNILKKVFSEKNINLAADEYKIFRYAISKGNMSAVQWLIEEKNISVKALNFKYLFSSRNEEMFEYLLSQILKNTIDDDDIKSIIEEALLWDNKAAIIILLNDVQFNPELLIVFASDIIADVELLHEIIDVSYRNGETNGFSALINSLLKQAANDRYLRALNYLIHTVDISSDVINATILEIIKYSNVKTLNWLLDNGFGDIYEIMRTAIPYDKGSVVQFLLEKYPHDEELRKILSSFSYMQTLFPYWRLF